LLLRERIINILYIFEHVHTPNILKQWVEKKIYTEECIINYYNREREREKERKIKKEGYNRTVMLF